MTVVTCVRGRYDGGMSNKIVVLPGTKYGHLVVIEEVAVKYKRRTFTCRCDCGNVVDVLLENMRSGNTRTCSRHCYCSGSSPSNRKDPPRRIWYPVSQVPGVGKGEASGLEYERRFNLWSCYRLSLERYNEILASQGGVCAMCKNPPKKISLHVDHDHACCPERKKSCGRCIRGLLCYPCNRFLGSYQGLSGSRATEYLLKYESREIEGQLTLF